jgi:hypothetical protein
MPRVVAGFLFAPLIFSLVFAAAMRNTDGFAIASTVVFPIALVLGLPMFFLFRWQHWLGWWQVTLGGLLCSLPLTALYLLAANPKHIEGRGVSTVLLFVGSGIGIAFLFWFISIWRNRALTAESTGRSQASAVDSGR